MIVYKNPTSRHQSNTSNVFIFAASPQVRSDITAAMVPNPTNALIAYAEPAPLGCVLDGLAPVPDPDEEAAPVPFSCMASCWKAAKLRLLSATALIAKTMPAPQWLVPFGKCCLHCAGSYMSSKMREVVRCRTDVKPRRGGVVDRHVKRRELGRVSGDGHAKSNGTRLS